ncbi:DNA adenine methylase [Actinobacillus ureae]|nr:DNA adenine methylase [Actinobacillus ureae]
MAINKKSDDFIIKSPLNYTGGKAKLLPQIKDKLPKKMTVFYDIFSGGANVGVNIKSESVFCIDKNESLINLMNYIKSSSYDELICILEDKINYYNLSDSFRNGYEFYGCNSSNSLGKYNKQGFNKLKQDYNKSKDNVLFLLLIIFGFNNQIRFNRKGDFNLPVGKRDFNSSLRKKLRSFIERIKNIYFICKDFRQLDIKALAKDNAFLYLDPPYILGTATYNENGGWTEEDERDFLSFLKKCDFEGIKFALSNVMVHNGDTHDLLLQWCLDNSFSIHYLIHSYNNANYQKKKNGAVVD